MARKANHATLATPQTGLEAHVRRLDEQGARRQEEVEQELRELRERWAPRLAKARVLLEQITASRESYGAAADALAKRDYSYIPPTPANLNSLAAIDRAISELSQIWESSMQDLERLTRSVEQLSPRTMLTFHAQAHLFEDYLRFYAHTPPAIETLWKQVQHQFELLAARLETSGEHYTPLPKLPPAPAPQTPEVEMA